MISNYYIPNLLFVMAIDKEICYSKIKYFNKENCTLFQQNIANSNYSTLFVPLTGTRWSWSYARSVTVSAVSGATSVPWWCPYRSWTGPSNTRSRLKAACLGPTSRVTPSHGGIRRRRSHCVLERKSTWTFLPWSESHGSFYYA